MDSPLDVIGTQIDLMRDDMTRKQVEIAAAKDHLASLIANRDELNATLDEWAAARVTLTPVSVAAPARLLAARV